jgi:1,2-diacylglycerol 3-alpha-glucosyltransferase
MMAMLSKTDRSMRILMLSDVYFPRVNGVSTSLLSFRRQLTALGHQVVLVAPEYGKPSEDETDILRVPSRYVFIDPEDRMMKPRLALKLVKPLLPDGFDLVHIQTPFVAHHVALRLLRALPVARVATYHTLFEEYLSCYVPFFPAPLLRAAARFAAKRQSNVLDGVIAPSRSVANTLQGYGVAAPIRVIPTGLGPHDLKDGDGGAFRRKHGIGAHRPVALYVGRVAFEKNISALLRVTEEVRKTVPDILLVIAGEGPAGRHLQQEVERLGLGQSVLFVGYLSRHEELPDCYRAADVFVFASATETQGLVLLEAMACGVPVVAVPARGTAELIGLGRGAVPAPTDPAGFASAVVQVLQDRDLRERLRAEARALAREWGAERLTGELVSFYEAIIAARRAAQKASTRPGFG